MPRNLISEREAQEICALWRKGCCASEIGRRVNRSRRTVSGYLYRRGLKPNDGHNQLTDAEILFIADRAEQGWTIDAIAAGLGRARWTVVNHVQRASISIAKARKAHASRISISLIDPENDLPPWQRAADERATCRTRLMAIALHEIARRNLFNPIVGPPVAIVSAPMLQACA